ncbi:GrpB family protein [Nostocales cyanobacterium LEGE 12452]|nr:GrpB family protein [Nostocales cyanobacterium LEGE 12452]
MKDLANRDRYKALKRDLATSFRSDREAYTNGKNEYIRAVMVKARIEKMGKSQSH